MSDAADEVQLVVAARGGDRDAFGDIYQRYHRMVHGVLLGGGRRGEGEDWGQDVFLRPLARLGSRRDPARLGGWLAMIARIGATDLHRRTRKAEAVTDELPAPEGDAHAEALAV